MQQSFYFWTKFIANSQLHQGKPQNILLLFSEKLIIFIVLNKSSSYNFILFYFHMKLHLCYFPDQVIFDMKDKPKRLKNLSLFFFFLAILKKTLSTAHLKLHYFCKQYSINYFYYHIWWYIEMESKKLTEMYLHIPSVCRIQLHSNDIKRVPS